MEKEKVQKNKKKIWLKRLGVGAILFFLLKGIAWIIVGVLGYKALF